MRRIVLQEGQVTFEFPEIIDLTKPAVEIHKNGRFLLFKAVDPIAADIFRDIKERMSDSYLKKLSYWSKLEAEEPDKVVEQVSRIEIWKHLQGDVAKHPLCKILQSVGVEVGVVPTLANYIRKEAIRQQREDTPFPTPVGDVNTTLFERSGVGTNLKCIKDYVDPGTNYTLFNANKHYMVVSSIGSGSDSIRISTKPIYDGIVIEDSSSAFEWSSFHPEMEEYFDDSESEDLGLTIDKKYPELVAMFRKRAEKLGYDVYDHNLIDASMEALKRGVLNCKLMRMAKSREAITIANLWESKKIAVFGSQNVRLTWEKEFQKIGITDYVVVDKLSDLDKPGRFYLMKYGWIRQKKDSSKDMRDKHTNYLKAEERKINRKVEWNYKPQSIKVFQYNPCPYCKEPLERFYTKVDKESSILGNKEKEIVWTQSRGYICRNKQCKYKTNNKGKLGAAWGGKTISHKGGTYVDYGLANHANCPEGSIKGRYCTSCGESDGTWVPQVTKRFKKKFTCVIPDEIHGVKDINTLTAEAVYRMRSKRKIGLTGTLLSNSALDAYWIMQWVIGGPRNSFPYLHTKGRKEFEERFCEHVNLEKPTGQKDAETGELITKTVSRRLPYLKSAPDWWGFSSPKIMRRNYSDPLYLASLDKAGMFKPEVDIKTLKVPMVPEQAKCMLAAIKDFKEIYQKAKEEAESKNQDINKAFVMSQMTAMRIIATVPQFINKKVDKDIYTGVPGGGKLYHISNLAKGKIANGEKVIILSDFIEMQKTIAKELENYGVIRFDTSWDDEKRRDVFKAFAEDPNITGIVAGTRSVSESLDFSVADTCICCDILWAPATQSQAWSRILTPINRERKCEIYIVLSENSIDEHMYNVFYAKLKMAEQAMDHRSINRRAMDVNYKWFIEKVIEEQANLELQLYRGDDESEVLINEYFDPSLIEGRTI